MEIQQFLEKIVSNNDVTSILAAVSCLVMVALFVIVPLIANKGTDKRDIENHDVIHLLKNMYVSKSVFIITYRRMMEAGIISGNGIFNIDESISFRLFGESPETTYPKDTAYRVVTIVREEDATPEKITEAVKRKIIFSLLKPKPHK